MPDHRASTPFQGVALPLDYARQRQRSSIKLLPAEAAFSRFAPELARLCRIADPTVAMTFSQAWWRAIPPPRGYAQRFLLLHRDGELKAAMRLRERMVFGVPTGILHATDAKGERSVLSARGTEAEWLAECIGDLFRSPRCTILLLTTPTVPGTPATRCAGMMASNLEQKSEALPLYWQTVLYPDFSQTVASMGHRTRRNLRHALRRVAQKGWRFLPDLTPDEVSAAISALSTRSTHPYTRKAAEARLELERTQERSFSMGLRSEQGEWLSVLTGVRRPGRVTEVFWQSNVAGKQDSVALTMRALLMRYEGESGQSGLRWIGGTAPLLEHCCQAEPGTQTLITQPGIRFAVLQRLLKTRLVSQTGPVQRLMRVDPSGT